MFYLLNEKHLIHKVKDKYIVENSEKKTEMDEDMFIASGAVEIKKEVYYAMLNKYYKNRVNQWKFNNKIYKNLAYFEVDENDKISNYDLKDIPTHKVGAYDDLRYVFHLGRVYFCRFNNKFDTLTLYNDVTLKEVKKTKIHNCAPICEVKTQKIV